MQDEVIRWAALLLTVGQLDVHTYTYVRAFESHKGYHAVVRSTGTGLYDRGGNLLKSIDHVRSIVVGDRFFWFLRLDSDRICKIPVSGAGAEQCITLPPHPGDVSALKFVEGSLYAFVDAFVPNNGHGASARSYHLLQIDERTSRVRRMPGEHSFSDHPQWCVGDALEYMFLNGGVVHLGGVKEFTLPPKTPPWPFLPESCAVNGDAVAVADENHLVINGIDTGLPSSGIVFGFQNGWLVQSSTGFKIYSKTGDKELMSGSMNCDLELYYDGKLFYLLDHSQNP